MSAPVVNPEDAKTAELTTVLQRAVVFDCNVERAAEVATVLRFLDMEPMLIEQDAHLHSVMQSCTGRQALLIGDVMDDGTVGKSTGAFAGAFDWRALSAALRAHLSHVTVVVYGPQYIADELTAAAGPARVLRISFPFKYASLAAALATAGAIAGEDAPTVRMPTGRSPVISETIGLIRQVAAHDSSVLILGESGTGKEVAAHAIHESSPRRQRPFVAINCGAIPAELLESELFGHERGAFTGAVTARKGRFEMAEGGTLFLDEIGDMSLPMQVKLLRVLQERVYERVGSQTQMRCDVRIIAATHRNLEESIARGAFREDLYYRLHVFPIEMPSLRSRIEDLPLLVRDFVRQNAAEGRGRVEFSGPTVGALMHYAWPGNVRELGNLVERLSILYPDRLIGVAELPLKYRPPGWVPGTEREQRLSEPETRANGPSGNRSDLDNEPVDEAAFAQLSELQLPEQGLDLFEHLHNIERELIRQALARCCGTVAQAARLLKLRRTTLVEKLRKLDLLADDAASEL